MSELSIPLIKEVSKNLNQAGFEVSLFNEAYNPNTSFDIIAKRQELILLIKCLHYIDKFKSMLAEELKMISKIISGYPLLIGRYTKNDQIHSGVIYQRSGVIAMDDKTLEQIVNGLMPIVEYNRGRYLINLKNDLIRKKRIEKNLSLQGLADRIHTSRRAVSMYESGDMAAKLDVAIEIEAALETSIDLLAKPLNLFQMITNQLEKLNLQKNSSTSEADFRKELDIYFRDMGLEMYWTNKSFIDAISPENPELTDFPESIKKHLIVTGIKSEEYKNIESKINIIGKISRILKSLSMLIVDDTVDTKSVIPVLSTKELKQMHSAKELIKKLYKKLNY
jgi:putative transcriptional regulator